MSFRPDDLDACLRVLQAVADDPSVMDAHERFKGLVAKVHRLGRKGQKRRREPKTRSRGCYVCKQPFEPTHPLYPQLCAACADASEGRRTARTDLCGRVALLVGGRVKIGFEVARKLLADGARLHLTTRFPADAAARLTALPDEWRERVTVHAADLRDPHAVEALADAVRTAEPHLDIIVHNAAQTVKRPLAFYRHLLEREARPVLLEARDAALPGPDGDFPAGHYDPFGQQIDRRPTNSWRQKLGEVPTLELLEALLVGAVAPFHLLTRLLPALQRSPHPRRFVVAVSAVEGVFGRERKSPHHPHTNMTKAALNMLVRTAAADLADVGVYVNCVDPGWVSHEVPHADAERASEEGFRVPLDLIDAAARVDDPIVRGLTDARTPPFGQYIKDYAPW